MLGAVVKPEGLIADEKAENFDIIVFIGGSGSAALWDNTDAHKIAKEALDNDKVVTAICLAPVILARAGVLANCQATVFKSARNELEKVGVQCIDKPVVRCGKVITGNGPSAVQEFTEAIMSIFQKK